MEVTLLGTGSPVPLLGRAGTSVLLRSNGEDVLVDCGPGTVRRMLEAEINPGDVEKLLFTHQHMDHNASFFHFAIAGWTLGGRKSLKVYGPSNTETLLDAMEDVYAEDIAYRKHIGYPGEGIEDIDFVTVAEGFETEIAGCQVRAAPVEHSIETYAYRFDDEESGSSVVISGDTRKLASMAEFAAGADLLIHDACMGPVTESLPPEEYIWSDYTEPLDNGKMERLSAVHCDAREAGQVAESAGVKTVVLTHLLPYRDKDAMHEQAKAVFDGDVIVGEDGISLTV